MIMQENQDNQATESTDTNAEAPASTLRDDLIAAFKGDTNLVDGNKEGDTIDEQENDTQEEEQESKEAEESADDELPVFEAPTNWKKEEKELFNKLPDELELEDGTVVPIKDILSKYDKSRQADYTRKTREVAELRNELSPLKDLIEPYKDNFERLGVKPADYMQQLINLDVALHKDPVGTIKQAMEKFQITPDKLGLTDVSESDDDDDFLTDDEKRIKQLEKKIEALEGKTTANEQTLAQKESQAEVNRILNEFETATDDSGELLHPYYNDKEVQDELSILVSRGKTLEEAYKASPRVKMLELENSNQATPKNDATEIRRQVAQAKRASLKVTSKKSTDYSDLPSLKDELKAKYFASSSS